MTSDPDHCKNQTKVPETSEYRRVLRLGAEVRVFCGTMRDSARVNSLKPLPGVGLVRTWAQEVGGSNPLAPI